MIRSVKLTQCHLKGVSRRDFEKTLFSFWHSLFLSLVGKVQNLDVKSLLASETSPVSKSHIRLKRVKFSTLQRHEMNLSNIKALVRLPIPSILATQFEMPPPYRTTPCPDSITEGVSHSFSLLLCDIAQVLLRYPLTRGYGTKDRGVTLNLLILRHPKPHNAGYGGIAEIVLL